MATSKRGLAIVLGGSLGLVALVGLSLDRARAEAPPSAAATAATAAAATAPASVHPVRAATVEHGPLEHPIRATGLVRAKKEVDLAFLVGGEVAWVGADVGAHVRRGQLLARLDTTSYAADAARADAAREKAERDLGRAHALVQTGSIAQASFDDATTGSTLAVAQASAADFALRHGAIVAPEDGVIDARAVEPGAFVAPGQHVFRLSGLPQGTVVVVPVGDRDVLGLAAGTPARVWLDARPEDALAAHVSQVASAATPATGTFEVEVHVDDPGHAADGAGHAPLPALPSGLSAKVEIARTMHPGSIVPVSALASGDGRAAYVFSLDQPRTRRLPVHVVFFEGDRAALAEPLGGAARVAAAGCASLTDGDAVQVVAP